MNRDMKTCETRVLEDQLLKARSAAPRPLDTSLLLERTRKRTREGPAPHFAKCLGCGYSVRGLYNNTGDTRYHGQCPECGRWFDPNDRSTFGSKYARRRSRKRKGLLWVGLIAVLFLSFVRLLFI